MKVAVMPHPSRPDVVALAAEVASELRRHGASIASEAVIADPLGADAGWEPGATPAVDLVIAVGGDGTFLAAARTALAADAPIVGVNAGTVGFLAEVETGRIGEAMERLVAGDYTISERMILDVELPDGSRHRAVNDAVVEKTDTPHVVHIGVSVSGDHLSSYRADAVVVATPTGSTAYTFSAGGPLIDPELSAIVVSPVAPHNLFNRAVVLPPEVTIEVEVERDRSARINVDGLTLGEMEPGERVRVMRGDRPLQFVRLWPRNFVNAVKEKFGIDV